MVKKEKREQKRAHVEAPALPRHEVEAWARAQGAPPSAEDPDIEGSSALVEPEPLWTSFKGDLRYARRLARALAREPREKGKPA